MSTLTMRRMQLRDRLASALVGVAVLAYAGWLLVVDEPGETAVRGLVATVMALGIAASAAAVVPGFAELVHGSKAYLAVTSALGVVALAAGVSAFVRVDTTMLAVLVLATVVMWAMATIRHTRRA